MVAICNPKPRYDDIVDVLRDMQRNVVFKSPDAAESAATLMLVIGIAADQIEYLRQGEPWFSASEYLPPMDQHGNPVPVLVAMPGGEVSVGSCDHDNRSVRWYCESTEKPTHWKPLPAPPRGK